MKIDTADAFSTVFATVLVAATNIAESIRSDVTIDLNVIVQTILLSGIGALTATIANELYKWTKARILKHWSAKNILKGFITTMLGGSFIAAGGYMIFTAISAQGWESIAVTTSEGISLIGLGCYFLGIEDPRLPKKGINQTP